MNNAEVRYQYHQHIKRIGELNKQWIAEGILPEDRARRANDIRQAARIIANAMMDDRTEAKSLEVRNIAKYGDAKGPTFEALVEQCRNRGLVGITAFNEIVEMCQRTNSDVDESCLEWNVQKLDALVFGNDYTYENRRFSEISRIVECQKYVNENIKIRIKHALHNAMLRWRNVIDAHNTYLENEARAKQIRDNVCYCEGIFSDDTHERNCPLR